MIIYKVTNNGNNMSYVGQTILGLDNRMRGHICNMLKRKYVSYFHRALKKYGLENFKWEILKKCKTRTELNESEIEYIKLFNTKIPNGYNMTDGGGGISGFKGKPLSEKHRKKISGALKGIKRSEETREKMRRANKGKVISDIQREKLRIAHLGRKLSKEHREKIGISGMGRKTSEKTKRKQSKSHKGKILSMEHRKKLSEIHKKRWNPELRKARSESQEKLWMNEEYREHMINIHTNR